MITRCSATPERCLTEREAGGEWRQESWHVIVTDMRHIGNGQAGANNENIETIGNIQQTPVTS